MKLKTAPVTRTAPPPLCLAFHTTKLIYQTSVLGKEHHIQPPKSCVANDWGFPFVCLSSHSKKDSSSFQRSISLSALHARCVEQTCMRCAGGPARRETVVDIGLGDPFSLAAATAAAGPVAGQFSTSHLSWRAINVKMFRGVMTHCWQILLRRLRPSSVRAVPSWGLS